MLKGLNPKKNYTFSLNKKLMEDVKAYCENENITNVKFITDTLKKELEGKTLNRKETDDYIILNLKGLNEYKALGTKTDIITRDNILNEVKEYNSKFNKSDNVSNSYYILFKINNMLDVWNKKNFQDLKNNDINKHKGLSIIIKEDITYYLMYNIDYNTYKANIYLIDKEEAIKQAKDSDNLELLENINNSSYSDKYNNVSDFKADVNIFNEIKKDNLKTNTELENEKLKKEIENLNNQIRQLKIDNIDIRNSIDSEINKKLIKVFDSLNKDKN